VQLYNAVDGAAFLTVSIITYVFTLYCTDWVNGIFCLQNFPSLLHKL